jgi:hypothetical protein
VPGTYKRKVCGLCGNFNGFAQDDLKTSSMQITNSPSVFGNSWKVNITPVNILNTWFAIFLPDEFLLFF